MRLLLACLALLLPLAAQAQPRDTLRVGMVQFPPDMHPNITTTSVKDFILGAVRRPMTHYDGAGRPICLLCTELPSLANGRARVVQRPDGTQGMEVRFTLKPDLFWADGQPVTARDVAFAFEVEKAFSVPPTVESVEALDAREVKVTLKVVRYDFDRSAPAPLAEHIEGPIFRAARDPLDYGQRSAFNRRPEEPGLWLGPYRIAEFRPNESVTLVPNEHWRGQRPHFPRIVVRLVENTSALQANLLSGDVDLVAPGQLGLTLDQHLALTRSQAARFGVSFIPSVSYEHWAVNLDNPLLADRRVRQALQMAINREAIVTRLFEGRYQVADSFLPPGQFGRYEGMRGWPFDPARARALLAEAGFRPGPDGILLSAAGERFALDFTTTAGNRVRELVAQVVQTQLKAVGVELVIRNEPPRVMFGETLRRRGFRGVVQFQNDPLVDWVPYTYFHSSYIPRAENNWTGTNYSGFSNAAMDQALTDAWAALEEAPRRAAWRRILDIANEELPEINLYFITTAVLTPHWLTGVAPENRWGALYTLWVENWRAK